MSASLHPDQWHAQGFSCFSRYLWTFRSGLLILSPLIWQKENRDLFGSRLSIGFEQLSGCGTFHGQIMLRLGFRFVGFLAVAAAFVSLIIDGTRSIASGSPSLTSLGQTAIAFFPTQFPALQPAIERNIHPLLWDPVLLTLFQLPTWLVIGLFGLLLLALTRKPTPKIGYSNR